MHLQAPDLVPGLGITVDERDMIVKAMSFKKGHWNKCKNGHVYCIDNCGGPDQIGICPTCKETIGKRCSNHEKATVLDCSPIFKL